MNGLATLHVLTALSMATLVVLEMRDPKFRAASFAASPGRRRNWAFLVVSFVPTLFVQAMVPHLFAALPSLVPRGTLPRVLDFVACVLAAEGATWVLHWIKHRQRFLWRFHFQHHRDEFFSVWMVTHTHALEVAVSGMLMVGVLIWLGFSMLSVQVYFALYSVALVYHHSAHRYSLGWLDKIIVSPAYHRRHHWRDGAGNYGGALTFWDVVFGTARWPQAAHSRVPVGLQPDAPEPFGFGSEMLYFLSDWRKPRL